MSTMLRKGKLTFISNQCLYKGEFRGEEVKNYKKITKGKLIFMTYKKDNKKDQISISVGS